MNFTFRNKIKYKHLGDGDSALNNDPYINGHAATSSGQKKSAPQGALKSKKCWEKHTSSNKKGKFCA